MSDIVRRHDAVVGRGFSSTAAIALSGFSALRFYAGAPMMTMTSFTALARGRRIRLWRSLIDGSCNAAGTTAAMPRTGHLTTLPVRPRLRGWIHVYCAAAALVAGAALVTVSWAVASRLAGHATLAYTLAIVAMFGVSATYHRVHWGSEVTRAWMRRLDHSMIYVFIAGTYTPFARLDMPRPTGHVVLAIVWGAALAGIALTVFWPLAPRWLSVALYLLLGWVGVWYTGLILHNAGVAATVLLGIGGVLYSLGAIFYALRWPDPWPSTFGYHEVFHACTAIAAICHFVAVCLAVF